MNAVPPRLALVVAARPNFMKAAPLVRELDRWAEVDLIHTGQHYDAAMSGTFFEELRLRQPDVNLGIGSGTHAEQTAGVLLAVERRLVERPADALVVVGDVNSTLAAALAAAKLGVPVAHVEAGLRSGDWGMPEEVNRVLTDRLSRWLFTPSDDADRNLVAEGIDSARIHLVGNVMIDTLLDALPEAQKSYAALADQLALPDRYAVLTLHRPGNVDDPQRFSALASAIDRVAALVPVLFPVHPRTSAHLRRAGAEFGPNVRLLEPLGYRAFLSLLDRSAVVLTDSGGIQEETSVLGVPCVTLRPNTERPVTCTHGTNVVAGTRPDDIVGAAEAALLGGGAPADIPLWDGKTAGRVAAVLRRDLGGAAAS